MPWASTPTRGASPSSATTRRRPRPRRRCPRWPGHRLAHEHLLPLARGHDHAHERGLGLEVPQGDQGDAAVHQRAPRHEHHRVPRQQPLLAPAGAANLGGAAPATAQPRLPSWIAKGGAQGLGWVERGERSTPFGVRTTFDSGKSLWSTSRGVFQLGPEATELYEAQGGEQPGGRRWPTSGSSPAGRGPTSRSPRPSSFGRISISVCRPRRDPHLLGRRGGPTSAAGMPAWHMWQPTSNGWMQTFSNGQVHFSGTTGARSVSGAIQTASGSSAAQPGGSATPRRAVGHEWWDVPGSSAVAWWHPAAGSPQHLWAIDDRYVGWAGPPPRSGSPRRARAWTGGYEQDFEAGLIRWDRATGTVTAIRR